MRALAKKAEEKKIEEIAASGYYCGYFTSFVAVVLPPDVLGPFAVTSLQLMQPEKVVANKRQAREAISLCRTSHHHVFCFLILISFEYLSCLAVWTLSYLMTTLTMLRRKSREQWSPFNLSQFVLKIGITSSMGNCSWVVFLGVPERMNRKASFTLWIQPEVIRHNQGNKSIFVVNFWLTNSATDPLNEIYNNCSKVFPMCVRASFIPHVSMGRFDSLVVKVVVISFDWLEIGRAETLHGVVFREVETNRMWDQGIVHVEQIGGRCISTFEAI